MPLFFTRLLPNFASCIRWLVDLLSFRKSLTRKRVWSKLIGSNSNSEGRNCRRSYLSDIILTIIRRSCKVSTKKLETVPDLSRRLAWTLHWIFLQKGDLEICHHNCLNYTPMLYLVDSCMTLSFWLIYFWFLKVWPGVKLVNERTL